MMKRLLSAILLVASVVGLSAKPVMTPLDPAEVERVRGLLSATTTSYAPTASNREVWDAMANDPEVTKGVFELADKYMTDPYPEWQGELYEQYPKTNIRKDADLMYKSRSAPLTPLVVAECLEYKGRYIPQIEMVLKALCEQPTWVMVAHDNAQDCFYRRAYHVDLGAAGLADVLAQTLYLLGDKLSDDVVEMVTEKLYERVYNPVLQTIRECDYLKGSIHSWITRDNNWNLVCIAGVTNSALAVIEDINVRAEFAAAAERYIQYGINGFLADGYCPEGIGYYNYGFAFLIRLREGLYIATNGGVDLFENERINRVATFGQRSEIINGVYPAITDCREGTTPSEWVEWYCCKSFGWDAPKVSKSLRSNYMSDAFINNFANSPCKISGENGASQIGIRSYFDKAGVLTCRPEREQWGSALGVVIKGGNNKESHNHNDVGSYTIAAGDELMMGDMGGPTAYTRETFSAVRYTKFPIFASYGHPLPLYNGVQQYESADAVGVVLNEEFSDSVDKISYDITSTYLPESKLTKATRDFIYMRDEAGTLSVRDTFSASEAISFETAITTRQEVKFDKRDKSLLYIIGKHSKIEVRVNSKSKFHFEQSEVESDACNPFTRVAVVFDKAAKDGDVELVYSLMKKQR